ncbi:MAG: lipid II flippase Amj family protein [Oricola sp.]
MDIQLVVILALTFVIHLIGTLAYAFRIAGIRTGHIAIAFSLFNVMVLVSRVSNSFQGPFLAKRVETAIQDPAAYHLATDFALILASASAATVVGGLLIPTLQRYATRAVSGFRRNRSMVRLMARALTPHGVAVLMQSATLPRFANLSALRPAAGIPVGIVILNFLASALWTVGVLAAIYAGSIDPEFRVTASTLSAIVNGVATIVMFVMIDPYLAGLTDDVVAGEASEAFFRRFVVWMVAGRLAGTLLAQLLLVPSAHLIVLIARWL